MQVSEVWKDIPEYEGLYQVSNLGRVKSLPKHYHQEMILKNKLTKDGYHETTLYKNNKSKCIRTHRLVAIAFIPNPNNKPQINHIDGNKLNNNVNNLEWCTNRENIDHSLKTGLQNHKGKNNPKAKSVLQYDLQGNLINRYDTLREATQMTGVLENKISMVCNHHSKTAGGYVWKFERRGDLDLCN